MTELEGKIIKYYEDEDNFIMKLEKRQGFNDVEYQDLINLYMQYILAIGETDNANRKVARFLLDIVTILEGQSHQLTRLNDPLANKVNEAHAKMLDLLYQLLI